MNTKQIQARRYYFQQQVARHELFNTSAPTWSELRAMFKRAAELAKTYGFKNARLLEIV